LEESSGDQSLLRVRGLWLESEWHEGNFAARTNLLADELGAGSRVAGGRARLLSRVVSGGAVGASVHFDGGLAV